jgi:hypothetical protein
MFMNNDSDATALDKSRCMAVERNKSTRWRHKSSTKDENKSRKEKRKRERWYICTEDTSEIRRNAYQQGKSSGGPLQD